MRTLTEKCSIPYIEKNIIVTTTLSDLFSNMTVPCTLVKAMTGFGKTSMTAECAKNSGETVMWYTLDWTDNDVDCFLEGIKKVWEIETQTDGQKRSSFGAAYCVRMLAQQIRELEYEKKQYMVFDNLQVITSDTFFHILFLLIQSTEDIVSFILLTNADVPKGFLALQLRGKARLFTEDDLRLSAQDAFTLFGCDTRITNAFGGWYLGIERTAAYLDSVGRFQKADWNCILQETQLSSYLDENFWEKCPKRIQEFFKQAAVLEEFSWEICSKIMSGEITRHLFEEAVSYRGIVQQVSQEKDMYRIGEAFRVYLCRMISDERRTALCSKASLFFSKQNRKGMKTKEAVLEICTFGTFWVRTVSKGKELAWRTRKGRELFAYLFDIEGKAVERQTLIEILWQDETPENAVAMLHNMIYNIRKELSQYGLESILMYENKRYRLKTDAILCAYTDVKELARLVEQKNKEQLMNRYQRFLTYWGRYLGDIDNIWVEEKRRYYDEIYKKGCFLLAEQFEQEEKYDISVTFYKNILSVEPYCEKAVAKMLSLYGRKREWDKMKTCYKNFSRTLQKDLGITPCKELIAAYHAHLTK